MSINVKKVKRVLTPTSDIGVKFDSNNSDYISLSTDTSIPLLSDINFDCSVTFDNTSGFVTYLFSIGTSSANYFSIAVNASGSLATDGNLNGINLSVLGQPITKDMTVSFDGVKVYQNGVETIDLSSKGVVTSNFNTGTLVTFSRLVYQASRYLDGVIREFSFQNETFKPTDRSNPIIGSEGTQATINTSHASGSVYIDEMFVQDKDAIKEFNAGDKMPAFRQNGYSLTFDRDNDDYLGTSKSISIGDTIEMEFLLTDGTIDQYFFSNYDNSFRALITLNFLVTGCSITKFTVDGVDTSTSGAIPWSTFVGSRIVLHFESSINSNVTNIFRREDGTNQLPCKLTHLSLANETFNLEEAYGDTITGSDGTVGTINTSHASGLEYIDANMWNKKSFALEFDSGNSEYLELETTYSLLDGESLSFRFSLIDSNVATLIGSNLTSIIYIKASTTYIQIRDTNQGNLTFSTTINVGEIYDLDVIRTLDNIECFINGTSIGVKATNSLALYNFKQLGKAGGTTYSNVTFYNLSLSNEQLNLTEGLGNELFNDEYDGSNLLELDAANSDYLEFPDNTILEGGSVSQTFKYKLSNTGFDYFVFGSNNLNEFLIYNVDNSFHLRDSEINNYYFTDSNQYGESNINIELTLNSGVYELFVNGVSKGTNNKLGSNITFNRINRRANGTTELKDIELIDFSINNETFNFSEGSGTTTTGSNGTVATINTSHASGSSYIDDEVWSLKGKVGEIYTSHASGTERINYGMWQKNGNVLEFDASNGDYLDLDTTIVLSGDFELMFDLTSNISSNSQALASVDGAPKLFLFGNGKIYFFTDTDGLYLSGINKLPVTGSFVYEIKRVGNDTMFYVDGAQVDTISGYNGDMTIDTIFNRSSAYFDGSVRSMNLNGEQFNFREGNGTETFSDSGNLTATIETGHASGTDYINSEIWNVETSKWIDYK